MSEMEEPSEHVNIAEAITRGLTVVTNPVTMELNLGIGQEVLYPWTEALKKVDKGEEICFMSYVRVKKEITDILFFFSSMVPFIGGNEIDLINPIISGLEDYAGSIASGVLNFYIDYGYNVFNAFQILPVFHEIDVFINSLITAISTIFNLGSENFFSLKQITLAVINEILEIIKTKISVSTDPTENVPILWIEIIKFNYSYQAMGLAIYDVCEKLLGDGLDFPQKLLFSLLWMIKITDTFSGSVLGLFESGLRCYQGTTPNVISGILSLEAGTILINLAIDLTLYLLFEVIFEANNIISLINPNHFAIISLFTGALSYKSYRLFNIKKMEINQSPEGIINFEKEKNIKFSLTLEFLQMLFKITGDTTF